MFIMLEVFCQREFMPMSVRSWSSCKCWNCGAANMVLEGASWSSFRPPQLDLRGCSPFWDDPEMRLIDCVGCGYVAMDLTMPTERAKSTMAGIDYIALVTKPTFKVPRGFNYQWAHPEAVTYVTRLLAHGQRTAMLKFMRHVLLQQGAGRHDLAFLSMLWAAQYAEDCRQLETADACRRKGIALADAAILGAAAGNSQGAPSQLALQIVLVDMLRRTGQWTMAIDLCDRLACGALGQFEQMIVSEQRALAQRADASCQRLRKRVEAAAGAGRLEEEDGR